LKYRAPQVYFVGETVKNLKAELARGAKLKCSKCGLKGAALGCYLKSCKRSYHAPCAMAITKCRWDYASVLYSTYITNSCAYVEGFLLHHFRELSLEC